MIQNESRLVLQASARRTEHRRTSGCLLNGRISSEFHGASRSPYTRRASSTTPTEKKPVSSYCAGQTRSEARAYIVPLAAVRKHAAIQLRRLERVQPLSDRRKLGERVEWALDAAVSARADRLVRAQMIQTVHST